MSTRNQANTEQNPDNTTLDRPSPFRRTVAWITIVAYIGQPLAVTAEVIADQAAAASNRPTVDTTANGLPLVQIATPNATGLSHNQYTQFNVGPQGVILNNSQNNVLTQQAGYVGANPNLVNGSARIILNEVTSNNRSQLNGYTEVAGQQAEVIIANPNGITCNGCGFINTSRGVLTTGTPVIGNGGSLDAFRVTGGDINIGSAGLNGSNLNQLDLITRSVQVNGELWANNLNVITGANQVAHDLQGVTVINGVANQPAVGIDVALLGGMYANKIYLVGTEAGVGVTSLGNLAAMAGDFTLDNAGQITLGGNTTASGNITIKGGAGTSNSGTLYSKQNVQITDQGTISNSGTMAAMGNLSLSAANINSSGMLGAGIAPNGTSTQSGTLSLTSSAGTIANSGRIDGGTVTTTSDSFANTGTVIGDNVTLNAKTLTNTGATAVIAGTQVVNLIIQNTLLNQDGATIFSLGDVNIGSNLALDANGYLIGNTGSVTNSSATIEAGGNLRVGANTLINQRTVVGVQYGPEVLGAPVNSGVYHYIPSYANQQFTPTTTAAGQLLSGGNMWLGGGMATNDYSDIIAGGTLNAQFAAPVNNIGAPLQQRMTVTNGTQDNMVYVPIGWHWGISCGWTGCWPTQVTDYGWVNQPIAYAPAPTYTKIANSVNYLPNTPMTVTQPTTFTPMLPSSGLYTIHAQPGQNYLVATDPRFTNYANFISSDYMLSRMALDPQLIQKRLGDGFYEQKLVLDQITTQTGRRFLGQYDNANEQYLALLEAGADAEGEFDLTLGVALTAEQINALRHDIVWLVDQAVVLSDGSTQHVLAPQVYLTRLHQADLKPSGALIAADVIDIKVTEQPQLAKAQKDFDRIAIDPAFNTQFYSPGFVGGGANDQIQAVLKDGVFAGNQKPNPVVINKLGNNVIANSKPLQTDGVFNNSGTIRAGTSLSIDAKDIVNRGGTISSGGNTILVASNDILNQSGQIGGNSVALTAGRDIISERLTETISGRVGATGPIFNGLGALFAATQPQSNYIATQIHGAAGITATKGLDMTAGRDITLAGSNVDAGGDATINAGNDLTVRTVAVKESVSNGVIANSRTEQLTSGINTGGNLTMVSANDMHLTSAALDIGKDASLSAGGDLTLDASKNVSSSIIDTEWYKSRNYDETVLGTTLNAGGDVTLSAIAKKSDENEDKHAGDDDSAATASQTNGKNPSTELGTGNIKLASATVNSKGTLALVADGNVDITTVDEKHESFRQTITESSGFFSSTTTTRTDESNSTSAKGSSLSGTNVILQAGDQTARTGDITIQGSNIAATEGVSIDAGHDLNIVSAENSASSSSSVVTTRKGFTVGSSGLEYGKNNTSTVTDGSTTQVASIITGKTILTQSGNDTHVRASNIQSTDNTTLYTGNNLFIESAANTTHHNQETTETKVGLNVAMMDGRLHDISVGTNGKITEDGNTSTTQVGSQIGSQGTVNLLSGNSMFISASKIKAGDDLNLTAGGDIIVTGQYDQATTDKSTANRMSSMKSKNKIDNQTQNYTFVGSSFDAGNNLNIRAGNNIEFTAAKLASGADTSLTAETGQIRFLTQKNTNIVSETFDNEDLVYEVHKGKGSLDETLVYTQINTGGKLNVDAAQGVVVEVEEQRPQPPADDKAAGTQQPPPPTFIETTTALAKQPGMEWMGQMLKRDDVDWKKVSAVHDKWDYKNQNLTEAGAVILVIVVTYFTAGTASSAATSVTQATGSAAVGAAAGAAVTTLATQAALSFANNGGDLGKTLDDLGKKESIRGLLTAMVTAGVLQGLNQNITLGDGNTSISLSNINAKSDFTLQLQKSLINNTASTVVNHAINGGDFRLQLEQSFRNAFIDTGAAQSANWIGDMKQKNNFNDFTHKLAHAIAGCAVGEAKAGDCGSGALGAVVGELSAEWYGGTRENNSLDQPGFQTDTVNFAKMMAGIAVAITGGDAEAVNLAASTGGNAAENNFLNHAEATKLAKLEQQKMGGRCDAACEQELAALKLTDAERNQELAACGGVSSGQCDQVRTEVRQAAASFIRNETYNQDFNYDAEKRETLSLAANSMGGISNKDVAAGLGGALWDGATSAAKGLGKVTQALFGDAAAQQEVKDGAGTMWDYVKDPENWPYLLGAMTPETRETLAQAYETGDAHAIGEIMGAQVANYPIGGGVGNIRKVGSVLDKAGDAAKATEKVVGRAASPTRFINDVKVVDQKTGQVFQGTVDLQPTFDRIATGEKFPSRNDGTIFKNNEGLLPKQPAGYYTEYVVPTQGIAGPGPQRLLTGRNGEMYYTPDHYKTFIPINKP